MELGLEGTQNCIPKASKESKEDSADTVQLLFSPTLKYSGSNGALCPTAIYTTKQGRGRRGRHHYAVKVAFEVDIHPGSYKVGPPTMLPPDVCPDDVDAHFKPDELEWLTKEKGNTVITGLLLHIEPMS